MSPISRQREPRVAAQASPSESRRPIAAAAVTWAIIPVTKTMPIVLQDRADDERAEAADDADQLGGRQVAAGVERRGRPRA